jgi:outer membrane protein assembly factor BamD
MTAKLSVFLLFFAVVGLLSSPGCSYFRGGERDAQADSTERQLYARAQSHLRSRNYESAIRVLELIEQNFPFGRYAEQAQLELIYARYRMGKMDDARRAADRFIRLHPNHPNVDYAYYMQGLAAFDENRGLLQRFAAVNPADRDTASARQAFADFSQLVHRFPESVYAPDARQRMIYLRNLLAEHELNVADYYMRRGAYVAAANRARGVVQHYSESTVTDDALAILVEANWRLGLDGAAQDALQILALNYPSHPGFSAPDTFEFQTAVESRDRSWVNILTLGILDRPDVPPPIRIDLEADEEVTAGSERPPRMRHEPPTG